MLGKLEIKHHRARHGYVLLSRQNFLKRLHTKNTQVPQALTIALSCGWFTLIFLIRKPRDLMADAVILFICGFQLKSFAISTPRYLAEDVASTTCPCNVYEVSIGFLGVDI